MRAAQSLSPKLITEIIDSTHIASHGLPPGMENRNWPTSEALPDGMRHGTDRGVSLKTFIERIKTRIKEAKEEGESPLSDETLDVVKILSIHRSEGT